MKPKSSSILDAARLCAPNSWRKGHRQCLYETTFQKGSAAPIDRFDKWTWIAYRGNDGYLLTGCWYNVELGELFPPRHQTRDMNYQYMQEHDSLVAKAPDLVHVQSNAFVPNAIHPPHQLWGSTQEWYFDWPERRQFHSRCSRTSFNNEQDPRKSKPPFSSITALFLFRWPIWLAWHYDRSPLCSSECLYCLLRYWIGSDHTSNGHEESGGDTMLASKA